MLWSVCLHDCVGEMEELGGGGVGVHVQAASGLRHQEGDQATLQRPAGEEGRGGEGEEQRATRSQKE